MKNNQDKILAESIKKLQDLSQLEGTELGEAWDYLVIINRYSYCFSNKFNKAVEKEILGQVKEAEEQFEIVEEEISNPYKRKVLRRKGC